MPENQPCCCDLKTGVTVLAILYILASVLMVFAPLLVISHPNYAGVSGSLAAHVLSCIIGALWLIINVLLLVGAANMDAIKCQIWLIGNPILYALYIVPTVLHTVYNDTWSAGKYWGKVKYVAMGIEIFLGIALQVYLFWVVRSFIEEIKNPPPPPGPLAIVLAAPRHPMGGQVIQYGYGYGGYPQQTPQYPLMAMQGQGGFTPPPLPPPPPAPPA